MTASLTHPRPTAPLPQWRGAGRMGRIAVATVLVVGLGLAAARPASAAEPRGTIRWHGCGPQVPSALRCGELAVPLDYHHPRGAKIRLGFNRLRAQDRKRR